MIYHNAKKRNTIHCSVFLHYLELLLHHLNATFDEVAQSLACEHVVL